MRAVNRRFGYPLIILLALLATWLLVRILPERSIYFELRLQMKVDRASVAQLFYDTGRGFNQPKSFA